MSLCVLFPYPRIGHFAASRCSCRSPFRSSQPPVGQTIVSCGLPGCGAAALADRRVAQRSSVRVESTLQERSPATNAAFTRTVRSCEKIAHKPIWQAKPPAPPSKNRRGDRGVASGRGRPPHSDVFHSDSYAGRKPLRWRPVISTPLQVRHLPWWRRRFRLRTATFSHLLNLRSSVKPL